MGGVPQGRKKGVVTAEIVTVPTSSDGNYTVRLPSSSLDIPVKLSQGDFNPGDKVEIPIQQLLQLPVGQETASDLISINQNPVDQIAQIIFGESEEISDSDKKMIQIALKMLEAFPAEVQDDLLQTVATGKTGSGTAGDHVDLISRVVRLLADKIPELLKTAAPELKTEIISLLSDMVSPVVAAEYPFEGAVSFADLSEDILTLPGLAELPLDQKAQESVKALFTAVQKEYPLSLFRYALGFETKKSTLPSPPDSNVDLKMVPVKSPDGDMERVGPHNQKNVEVSQSQTLPESNVDSTKRVFEKALSYRVSSPNVLSRLRSTLNSVAGSSEPVSENTALVRNRLSTAQSSDVEKSTPSNVEPSEQKSEAVPVSEKAPVLQSEKPDAPTTVNRDLGVREVKSPVIQEQKGAEISPAPVDKPDSIDMPRIQNIEAKSAGAETVSGERVKSADLQLPGNLYESVVSEEGYSKEFKKFVAARFPNINSFLPEIELAFDSPKKISSDQLQQLEMKLEEFQGAERERPFLRAVVSKALSALSSGSGDISFPKIISQIEPVSRTVATIEEIIEMVKSDESDSSAIKDVSESVERLKQTLLDMQELFNSADGTRSDRFDAGSVKKAGDLWGLFFENTLKNHGDEKSAPRETSIKQELLHLHNQVTKKLISQTVKNETHTPERALLQKLNSKVSDAVQRIEGGQILAQPKETTSAPREQVMWIPVQMGGEWTRLGIEFRREGKRKGQGKLGNRVNIQMDLKKMGLVTAELDLDAGKQLRVTLGASRPAAVAWFKEHEQEIYASLNSEQLRSVIFSIRGIVENGDLQQRKDSFQVTG